MRFLSALNLKYPNMYFLLSVACVACFYLVYQLAGIPNWILGIDEFFYARHLHEFTYLLPYRDFQPIKPVLGLYLLSLPMIHIKGILLPLFYIKYEIAVINASCIMLAGALAAKQFDHRAIVLALLAVSVNGFFIYYSTELRVDMLAGWCCLFALLAYLSNRFSMAGILLGIGFLISQKVSWYIVGINSAALFNLVWFRDYHDLKAMIKFNLWIITPIIFYIAICSYFSSLQTVLDNLFFYAYGQGYNSYFTPDTTLVHFKRILTNTMVLFSLLPYACLVLLLSWNRKSIFLAVMTAVMIIQLSNYPILFIYNYDFILPMLYVIYAYAITLLIDWYRLKEQPLFRSNILMFISVLYSLAILYTVRYLNLHIYADMIALMPLLITLLFAQHKQDRRQSTLIALTGLYVAFAIIYPFYQMMYLRWMYQGQYQQTILTTLDKLLADNGDYVAGATYFYYKDQPISGLKNLITPQQVYLHNPEKYNAGALRDTFYLAPVTADQVIAEFEKSSVKVVVSNPRMVLLPLPLKNYIMQNYARYYGSLYIYAPTITGGTHNFDLKFPGKYQVNTGENTSVTINGRSYSNNQLVTLTKGAQTVAAAEPFRLELIPPIDIKPNGESYLDYFLGMDKLLTISIS